MKYAGDYIVIPNIYYGRFLGLAIAIMTMAGAFNTLVLVIAGYFVDQLIMRFVMPRQYRLRRRQLCSESILALCAKAMCAGGEVTATAMQALRKQLLIVGGQQQMAMDIVRREQQSLEGFEEHAARLVQMLAHHPDDLDLLMRTLVIITIADGDLNDGEEEFLIRVAGILGIQHARLKELVGTAHQFKKKEERRAEAKPAPHAAAYRILGLAPGAKWEEIRRRYRNLVREHHPDKLHSSGKSAAELKRAEAEMARINEAFDTLEQFHQKKDATAAN